MVIPAEVGNLADRLHRHAGDLAVGVEREGHISGLDGGIVEVDRRPVQSAQELGDLLETKQPGEILGLTVMFPDLSRSLLTIRIPAAGANGR